MIDYFETSIRINPDDLFFTYVDENGHEIHYTYWQARLISATLARKLQNVGIRATNIVAIDLPNCPELIFFALACAYGGYTMALFPPDMSESEKLTCSFALERAGTPIRCIIDEGNAYDLLYNVRSMPEDESDIIADIYSESIRSRSIMGESQDLIDDTVHFAERAAHLFDSDMQAVVIFAGGQRSTVQDGKRDKLRAIPLSWTELLESSALRCDCLTVGSSKLWQERLPFNSFSMSGSLRKKASKPDIIWQCVLPLTMIDGLQTFIGAVVSKTPFRLHALFDAERILLDSEYGVATHIVVDDSALQDLMTVEEWRGEATPGVASRLCRYQCVLLVGRNPDGITMKRAYDLGARIFASYGLPETSGTVATSQVTQDFYGGVQPLPGYEARIVDPDDEGFGRLAIKGPGVFAGYLNMRTAFSVDHFFITEERAAIENDLIYIKNKRENMFVSAGQNIYPVEIAEIFRHVSGVAGVHVFGVEDTRCGMLPVAAIERSDPMLTPQDIENETRRWFSHINVPISIFVFDQLPRTEQGTLNRRAIEAFFQS